MRRLLRWKKHSKIDIFLLIILIVVIIMILVCVHRANTLSFSYDEIDYINLVSHECKEIHATEAKEIIADAFNNCKRLKRYHQGEPIIGTPDYQIVIYFYDGRKITLEQGGHIYVLKDGKETEYSSEIDCGRLIELIGFFAEPAFE